MSLLKRPYASVLVTHGLGTAKFLCALSPVLRGICPQPRRGPSKVSILWGVDPPESVMDARFPHILNPPISGFSPMVHHSDHEELLPQEDDRPTSSTGAEAHPYQQQAVNGSRKRPASRIKSTYPRRRAIQACQKCRARRTKCNNVRPTCSSCEDLGVECNYSAGDPSR